MCSDARHIKNNPLSAIILQPHWQNRSRDKIDPSDIQVKLPRPPQFLHIALRNWLEFFQHPGVMTKDFYLPKFGLYCLSEVGDEIWVGKDGVEFQDLGRGWPAEEATANMSVATASREGWERAVMAIRDAPAVVKNIAMDFSSPWDASVIRTDFPEMSALERSMAG